MPLLPFQKQFLAWAVRQEQGPIRGGILADEMGMGKTIQAISLIVTHRTDDFTGGYDASKAPVAVAKAPQGPRPRIALKAGSSAAAAGAKAGAAPGGSSAGGEGAGGHGHGGSGDGGGSHMHAADGSCCGQRAAAAALAPAPAPSLTTAVAPAGAVKSEPAGPSISPPAAAGASPQEQERELQEVKREQQGPQAMEQDGWIAELQSKVAAKLKSDGKKKAQPGAAPASAAKPTLQKAGEQVASTLSAGGSLEAALAAAAAAVMADVGLLTASGGLSSIKGGGRGAGRKGGKAAAIPKHQRPGQNPHEAPVAVADDALHAVGDGGGSGAAGAEGAAAGGGLRHCKATLVICPVVALIQWCGEIAR